MTKSPDRAAPRVFALLILTSALASCAREPAPRPDAEVVVAVVNGAQVTLADLKNEIVSLRGFSSSLSAQAATRAETAEAVRRLVEKSIVLAEGARLGVTASSAEVEEEIRRFRADFPPGGLETALLKEGIEFEAWRAQMRRVLLYRKAASAIAEARAEVREAEIEKEYRKNAKSMNRPERIRLRQFLFGSEDRAREAERLIRAGKEPGEAARQAAGEDSPPPVAGLGFVTRDDLAPELAEELFALPEGGTSRVIRQEEAFCLFLVEKKEPARTLNFAAAAPEIREELMRTRREEAFRKWLSAEAGRANVRLQQELLDRFAGERR